VTVAAVLAMFFVPTVVAVYACYRFVTDA